MYACVRSRVPPQRPVSGVFQSGYHRQIYRDCARNYLLARDTSFVTPPPPSSPEGNGVLSREARRKKRLTSVSDQPQRDVRAERRNARNHAGRRSQGMFDEEPAGKRALITICKRAARSSQSTLHSYITDFRTDADEPTWWITFRESRSPNIKNQESKKTSKYRYIVRRHKRLSIFYSLWLVAINNFCELVRLSIHYLGMNLCSTRV